jgi:hypothetical protein
MKQKILGIIITFLCSITLLTGCDRIVYYSGDDFDLFSVAVNSLLGVNGYGRKGSSPRIELIEEDSYGRKLFSYLGDGFVPTYSLLICQKSDEKYSYYYPDYNFISAEYKSQELLDNSFTIEEINELKELNDWNKEINEEKCVKVEMISKKDLPKITKKKENQFQLLFKKVAKSTGYKGDDNLYRYAKYCTSDNYGRTLYYVYGIGTDVNGEGVSPNSLSREFHIVIIFKPDGTIDENICVMELTDIYKYQDGLKRFKELNSWNQP